MGLADSDTFENGQFFFRKKVIYWFRIDMGKCQLFNLTVRIRTVGASGQRGRI